MTQFASPTQSTKERAQARALAKPRAAIVVYRIVDDQPQFLLISSSRNPKRLTLPGGKLDRDETSLQAAVRETREEAGVLTSPPRALSQYLHRKQSRRVHPTETFLARYVCSLAEREKRRRCWVSLDDLVDGKVRVRRAIRRQLDQAAEALLQRAAA